MLNKLIFWFIIQREEVVLIRCWCCSDVVWWYFLACITVLPFPGNFFRSLHIGAQSGRWENLMGFFSQIAFYNLLLLLHSTNINTTLVALSFGITMGIDQFTKHGLYFELKLKNKFGRDFPEEFEISKS